MATERQLQEAMALSAGMIGMIDDAVGDIVAALRDTGRYDDTVICFTSDHGDYLGDFGLLRPHDGIRFGNHIVDGGHALFHGALACELDAEDRSPVLHEAG